MGRQQRVELGAVPTGHVLVPGVPRRAHLRLPPRRRGDPPVLVLVPVQVLHLDGRVFEVEPQVARLPGRQQRVHHGGHGTVLEAHEGAGHVLGGRGARLPVGDGGDLGPLAQHGEQEVHLVDAVAHRGTTALDLPVPAPRHREVLVRPIPERVADRHERPAEVTGLDQAAQPQRGAAEAVLEDGGEPGPAGPLGGQDVVEFGQREGRGFLAQHRDTRRQAGDGLLVVRPRGRAEVDEVGCRLPQRRGQVGVPVLDAPPLGELVEPPLVHVDRGDQFRTLGQPAEPVGMGVGDAPRADDGDTRSSHRSFVSHRRGNGPTTAGHAAGAGHERRAGGPVPPRPPAPGAAGTNVPVPRVADTATVPNPHRPTTRGARGQPTWGSTLSRAAAYRSRTWGAASSS